MRIHINHLLWELKVVPTTDPELRVDGELCRGATWYGKQQIFLAAELNANTALRVIIHELTHAYLWSTQMRLPDTFTEEEICEFVACWAFEILDTANSIYTKLYGPGTLRNERNENDRS